MSSALEPAANAPVPTTWAWTWVLLALLLAWDTTGLDMALARLAGGAQGFALRNHWLFDGVLHKDVRNLGFLAAAWLFAGIWWPTGVLQRISRAARVQWLASAVLAIVVVNLVKSASRSSCPWDLADFGGVGIYLSHWSWGQGDGGPGRCFPAGHASTAFGFIGGFFALFPGSPRLARRFLAALVAAGLLLGIAQQLRGAHFMSHTLWTGWLCWFTALSIEAMRCRAWRGQPWVAPP